MIASSRASSAPSSHAARADLIAYLLVCIVLLGDAWRVLDAIAATSPSAPGLHTDRLIMLAAFAVLAALGALASRRDAGRPLAFAIGAACGLLFFARTLGSALADPTAIGWLLNGDWAQHYSGWAMFRDTPWSWPPGLLPEIWYPIGTSIVYTDSLPLLALLLKPFSAWLPHPFQYIGLWFLLNAMLQGGFGALLIARVTRSPAAILAGAALFVFAPVFINRIGHDTLTAHWLLLAALWLYFRETVKNRLIADAWPWWPLSAAAALVHPYLAAMTLAIQAAYWWKRARIDRDRTSREAWTGFGASVAIAAAMWWLSGAMIIPHSDGAGGVAYGKYSFNLLGFFNPMYFSRLLPNLPGREGQYEGFAYLGIGMLALGVLMIVDAARARRVSPGREWKPLIVVSLALLAFAASTVLAIGSWTLIDVPIQSSLIGIFRSSGRFVWVAYYALMFAIMQHVLRRFAPTIAAAVLGLVLIAQMFDFSVAHLRTASLRIAANDVPKDTQLDDPRWATLAATRSHLTLLPPIACGHQAGPYLPFLLFAADHGMTLNSGYLARWDLKATNRYCDALGKEIAAGALRKDSLYVVGADWKNRLDPRAVRCERLNGYDACLVDEPASP